MVIGIVIALAMLAGQQPIMPFPPHVSYQVPPAYAYKWKWTEDNWSASDDRLLQAIRARQEEYFANGRSDEQEVKRRQKLAQAAPANHTRLYEWGYTSYLSHHADEAGQIDGRLSKALTSAKAPFTREFIRMRFLVMAEVFIANDYVVALGERLAKDDPNDFDVIEMLSKSMFAITPEAKRRAIAYSKRLLELKPENPAGYASMASNCYDVSTSTSPFDIASKRQAIHWIDEYLKREKRPGKDRDLQLMRKHLQELNATIAAMERFRSRPH